MLTKTTTDGQTDGRRIPAYALSSAIGSSELINGTNIYMFGTERKKIDFQVRMW